MRSRRGMAAAALLAFLAIAAGCDEPGPNDPGGGGTSMAITDVTPESPVSATTPQVLTISGRNFLTQPVLFVTEPDGTQHQVTGPNILDRQISSFRASVVLAKPGRHELRVGPDAGAQSPPFGIVVRATSSSPAVFNVEPAVVVRGAAVWTVTLHGINFEPGALVLETDPDGFVTQIVAPQIISTAPATLRFTRSFSKLGLYTFVVVNPAGEQSNPVTISAT